MGLLCGSFISCMHSVYISFFFTFIYSGPKLFASLQLLPDWTLHQASWVNLPRQPEIWGSGFNPARDLVFAFVNTLIDFEPVAVLCDSGQATVLRRYLDSRVMLVEMQSDELWLSAAAPSLAARTGVLRNGSLMGVEFAMRKTGRVPLTRWLAAQMNLPFKRFGFSMLRGDYSVDGSGAILLCQERLLNSSRIQPERDVIERLLGQHFGITRPIWLPQALARDRRRLLTNLARFIEPSEILLASHANRSDSSMSITLEAYDQLTESGITDGDGNPYSVHQVHNPVPLRLSGHYLCCSYLNFYRANRVICIPAFYKPRYDKRALELFRVLFPDHEIRQFQVLPLQAGGGGLNCLACPWPVDKTTHHRLLDKAERIVEAEEEQQQEQPLEN